MTSGKKANLSLEVFLTPRCAEVWVWGRLRLPFYCLFSLHFLPYWGHRYICRRKARAPAATYACVYLNACICVSNVHDTCVRVGVHASCLGKCACANRYEASSRVFCSSEKITLGMRLLPGTRPADSNALLFLHVCQMWRLGALARTHVHRCCQQFPSSQTPLTPKWDRVCQLGADDPPGFRTLSFTVPSRNHRLLIDSLQRLFTLLNFFFSLFEREGEPKSLAKSQQPKREECFGLKRDGFLILLECKSCQHWCTKWFCSQIDD